MLHFQRKINCIICILFRAIIVACSNERVKKECEDLEIDSSTSCV